MSEYTPVELAQWLDAKFRRHGEPEDGAAADLIRAYAAALEDLQEKDKQLYEYRLELNLALERLAERGKQLAERDAEIARLKEFQLQEQSRESVEARFYRYLRDEAGQYDDDEDGPMICAGLGDQFEYLRGEECDEAIRAAIEARAAIAEGEKP